MRGTEKYFNTQILHGMRNKSQVIEGISRVEKKKYIFFIQQGYLGDLGNFIY